MHGQYSGTPLKRRPLGPKNFVRYSEVSLAQGLLVDHAPPIIVASTTMDNEKDRIDERFVNLQLLSKNLRHI